MNSKNTIEQIDVRSKRVLVRLDLNVPLDDRGQITDDRRITSALPTVLHVLNGGGRVILCSHLGRPKSAEDQARLSLAPVAARLSQLLERPVPLADGCRGPAVSAMAAALADGDVCLLENLRFEPAETIKDKKAAGDPDLRSQKDEFAGALAGLADVYVNDAFATCHRDNASMLTVPALMEGKPRVVGFLLQKELKFLGSAVTDPRRPFVCVLGGAKVSDKIPVIRSLLSKCDSILVGGAMAFTFLAAEGVEVGKSLVEPDRFDIARTIRSEAGKRLEVPVDSIAAARIAKGAPTTVCNGPIPADLMGLDIGPATLAMFERILRPARTIVWNGPMGVFETPPFDVGTIAIAKVLAEATAGGAVTIVGGGDSAAAIRQAGLDDQVTHVSTGGGASLEFLEGKSFACLDVLDDA